MGIRYTIKGEIKNTTKDFIIARAACVLKILVLSRKKFRPDPTDPTRPPKKQGKVHRFGYAFFLTFRPFFV